MKFYSPKNFKKGRHIGGLFRMIDVLLLAAGSTIFIPMILFILTRDDINFILLLIMAILYGCIILLIQPFPPIYHNFFNVFPSSVFFHKMSEEIYMGRYRKI